MRFLLPLLSLSLLVLYASTAHAAFVSLENPAPGPGKMTWDLVLNPTPGGDTLGSIDLRVFTTSVPAVDLSGVNDMKGTVLADPDSLVITDDQPSSVQMGGFNINGAETFTGSPRAFGTLTVSWHNPLTEAIVIENDPLVTGYLDSNLQPIPDTTAQVLAVVLPPAAPAIPALPIWGRALLFALLGSLLSSRRGAGRRGSPRRPR